MYFQLHEINNHSKHYCDCIILTSPLIFYVFVFAFVLCTCSFCLSFPGVTYSSHWLTVPQVKEEYLNSWIPKYVGRASASRMPSAAQGVPFQSSGIIR